MVTSLCTEGIKKILNEKEINFSSNMLAFIVACVIGVCGTAVYYILSNIPFNLTNVICMMLMGFASAIGAMVGYDKVIQTIKQISESKQ
jgi:Na+-driven multidrug efflux pump